MPVQSRALRDGFTPSTTFDPTGALDGLVIERVEGVAIFAEPAPEPPAFDPYTLVDPDLDDRDVPAEVKDLDPADDIDRAWWIAQCELHRPEGVAPDLYREMCTDASLGSCEFFAGFEPHASDFPGLDDVPLPTWDDPLPCEV